MANLVLERRRERRAETHELRAALDDMEDRLMGQLNGLGERVSALGERTAGIEGVVHWVLGTHDPSSRPTRRPW